MCIVCGCDLPRDGDAAHGAAPNGAARNMDAASVQRRVLAENDAQAADNRRQFDRRGVFAINMMGSPGAGKTALLEATIDALKSEYRIAVIEGDLETENDTLRIRARGVPAVQIGTASACHLDALMLRQALHHVSLAELDLVFIENVGNLVCPAGFDLGQHRNVVLLSVTQGDDKPTKYPAMFRCADAVLLSKCDLLPVLDDFEPRLAALALRSLGRDTPMIHVAARRATSVDAWLKWLRTELADYRRVQWLPVLPPRPRSSLAIQPSTSDT